MSDFKVRSDNIDVEQIMQQIRARVREKRGVDYTEAEIRELASVKLERFLDPTQLRSELVEQFRKAREGPPPETYEFEDTTIYESHRLPLLSTIRRLLNPILKLFLNPNPIIRALHLQSRFNKRLLAKESRESLEFEVMANLVLELTRLSVEVKNLRMRVESLSTRLDFDERRARALEGIVQLKPGALSPDLSTLGPERAPAEGGERAEGESGSRAGRRRRRRRRRRPGGVGEEGAPGSAGVTDAAAADRTLPSDVDDDSLPGGSDAGHDGPASRDDAPGQ